MKKLRAGLLATAVVAGALVSTQAWSQHRHGYRHGHSHARVGVYVGAPLFWSPFWYPYPYYYPPVVVRPSQPVEYIEQGDGGQPAVPAPQAQQNNYWYYCPDSRTYYPYASTCASPWQRVIPHAPPG